LEKPGSDEVDVITLPIDQAVSSLLENALLKLDAHLGLGPV
jgi:hypothetical protein